MERSKALALLAGFALGAVTAGGSLLLYQALTSTMIMLPGECPLEFGLSPLNTTSGWFYDVGWQRAEPRSFVEYNVTFFVFSQPDQYGNQRQIVHWSGSLDVLVSASGNFSFEDRGIHPGKLDNGGDYFWAREWHVIHVTRAGQLVGGTVACL